MYVDDRDILHNSSLITYEYINDVMLSMLILRPALGFAHETARELFFTGIETNGKLYTVYTLISNESVIDFSLPSQPFIGPKNMNNFNGYSHHTIWSWFITVAKTVM